jgi:hypothetical protein
MHVCFVKKVWLCMYALPHQLYADVEWYPNNFSWMRFMVIGRPLLRAWMLCDTIYQLEQA